MKLLLLGLLLCPAPTDKVELKVEVSFTITMTRGHENLGEQGQDESSRPVQEAISDDPFEDVAPFDFSDDPFWEPAEVQEEALNIFDDPFEDTESPFEEPQAPQDNDTQPEMPFSISKEGGLDIFPMNFAPHSNRMEDSDKPVAFEEHEGPKTGVFLGLTCVLVGYLLVYFRPKLFP